MFYLTTGYVLLIQAGKKTKCGFDRKIIICQDVFVVDIAVFQVYFEHEFESKTDYFWLFLHWKQDINKKIDNKKLRKMNYLCIICVKNYLITNTDMSLKKILNAKFDWSNQKIK